jgi:hypothetical protein
MSSLRDLFEESYISVPDSKVDLVDELAEKCEELENQLNETLSVAIEQAKLVEDYERKEIVAEAAVDLADTEVEKLLGLVENIDFEDAESFAKKVETIKETYFSKATKKIDLEESVNEDAEQDADVSDTMSRYIQAIRRSNS